VEADLRAFLQIQNNVEEKVLRKFQKEYCKKQQLGANV
jgi:hypothetical protein